MTRDTAPPRDSPGSSATDVDRAAGRLPGYHGSKSTKVRALHYIYWGIWVFTGLCILNYVVEATRRAFRGERRTTRKGSAGTRVVRTVKRSTRFTAAWIGAPARFDMYVKSCWIWHPNTFLPFETGHSAIRADPTQKRDPTHSVPNDVRNQVFARDDGQCVVCGASSDGTALHLDHIVPVSRGGPDTPENLRFLCETCHQCRHSRLF